MEKSFFTKEVIPALCIPLVLVVIPLFVSWRTKKAGFPYLQCSFCTISSAIIIFLLKSVSLRLLLHIVTDGFLYIIYKWYLTV